MKFEYGLLQFDFGLIPTKPDSKGGKFIILSPDGKHLSRTGKVGTLMAELGSAGWELVVADSIEKVSFSRSAMAVYTFKRRID